MAEQLRLPPASVLMIRNRAQHSSSAPSPQALDTRHRQPHTSGQETYLNLRCQPADEVPTAGPARHVREGEGTRALWGRGWYLRAACVGPPGRCGGRRDIRLHPQGRPDHQGGAGLRRRRKRRACGRGRRGAGLFCVAPLPASYHVPSR